MKYNEKYSTIIKFDLLQYQVNKNNIIIRMSLIYIAKIQKV